MRLISWGMHVPETSWRQEATCWTHTIGYSNTAHCTIEAKVIGQTIERHQVHRCNARYFVIAKSPNMLYQWTEWHYSWAIGTMEEAKTSDQQCVTHDESGNTNQLSHDSNRNERIPWLPIQKSPTSTLNSAQRRERRQQKQSVYGFSDFRWKKTSLNDSMRR